MVRKVGKGIQNLYPLTSFTDSMKSTRLADTCFKPFNCHTKIAQQRTIIPQYSDWYTGR